MKGDNMKWLYSFILLGVTLVWSVFLVLIIRNAVGSPTPAGIIAAAEVGGLEGFLISGNMLIIQYWFRKKGPTNNGA